MATAQLPPRPTILVVDDEPSHLQRIAELLRDEHDIRLARDGEKALALVRQHRPDLVLLDVDMPGMGGYDVCRALMADPQFERVPIIFLTTRTNVEELAYALSLGAVDTVHKPISAPLLKARVRTHVALRVALDEARRAKQNADRLLEVVLPRPAAEELRATHRVAPRRIDEAAVVFVDPVDFTAWCDAHEPEEIVPTLHGVFLEFEGIARAHGLEKLKTVGDTFMAGAGLLSPSPDPLLAAVRAGLDMATAVSQVVPGWSVRIGVNVGPVVAGIVGGERFQFDVWGDTVNVAARLAQVGHPGVVTIRTDLVPRLEGKLNVRSIGARPLKGKGDVAISEVPVQ